MLKGAAIKSAGWTLLFVAGAFVLTYGVWLAYRPAGFIFGGLLMAVCGFGGWYEMVKADRR